MKSRIPIIWIIIFLFGLVQPLPIDSKVLVTTTKDVVERYNKILDEQKKSIDEISHLKSKHAHRAVASMVIFLKALQVSESNIKTEFLIVPNNRRLKAVVESGGAVAGLADLWSATFNSNVYQSTAVIPSENYFVGFYGLEENKNLLHLKERLNFEKLTAVSSPLKLIAVDIFIIVTTCFSA